jgi:glycosyltransferase-like protein
VADRRLRIALLTYSTRPRGGVVHALELAEALQARGQQVRLFALEKPGREAFFRPTSVPTSFIPVDERPGETMDDKIHRYIDAYVEFLERELPGAEPYDVYHAEDCISGNALVRLRRAGLVPWVVRTVHHIDDFTSPALISCQHDSIVEPDTVLVVSEWWRDRLAEDLGVPARVVYNGVDLDRYVPPASAAARDAVRARLGLDGTAAVLAVGGVEPRKNSIVLLDAFVEAQDRLAALTGRRPLLVFAGGASLFDHAEYRDAFEARLRGHVAGARLDPASVWKTGPVEDDVLLGLYQAADVLAFPSVREGWGLTVLEAQASATPVVASDIEVLREYLVDGQNALLVAPDDADALGRAIVRAATDPDLAATLRAGGLATARRFSWGSSAERHVEVYRELLA